MIHDEDGSVRALAIKYLSAHLLKWECVDLFLGIIQEGDTSYLVLKTIKELGAEEKLRKLFF